MELPSDKQHAENTSSQKNTKRKANMSAEYYRKKLIDLRASLAQEREKKKADNAHYADLVKRASSPSSKATYRKNKIDAAARHDRAIENLKRQIESTKESLARERKRK